MADQPGLLYGIANDLLVVCEQLLREAGQPAVDRTFVNTGPAVLAPVDFGEAVSQLTVTAGPISPDQFTNKVQQAQGMAAAGHLWKVLFTIVLLRPFPVLGGGDGSPLPDDEQLNEAAKTQLADGWQLARGLAWHWMHGNLTDTFQFTHENVQWQSPSFVQLDPSGGIAGWQAKLTVSVHDQYAPETMTPNLA